MDRNDAKCENGIFHEKINLLEYEANIGGWQQSAYPHFNYPALFNNDGTERSPRKSSKMSSRAARSSNISPNNTSPALDSIRSPTIRKSTKRKKSTDKERLRNLEIKARLRELTEMMPFVGTTELPRIRILRLANQYILHLRRMLQGEYIFCEKTGRCRPLEKEDFAQIVTMEMQIKNSYSDRIDKEMGGEEGCESSSSSKQSDKQSASNGGGENSGDEKGKEKEL